MKVVNDVMDESTNVMSAILSFVANLVAPEDDEGTGNLNNKHPIKLQKAELLHGLIK